MIIQGIALEHEEHQISPARVGGQRRVERDRYERPDVQDTGRLGVELCDDRIHSGKSRGISEVVEGERTTPEMALGLSNMLVQHIGGLAGTLPDNSGRLLTLTSSGDGGLGSGEGGGERGGGIGDIHIGEAKGGGDRRSGGKVDGRGGGEPSGGARGQHARGGGLDISGVSRVEGHDSREGSGGIGDQYARGGGLLARGGRSESGGLTHSGGRSHEDGGQQRLRDGGEAYDGAQG
ncbi:hypothetical protein GUJ93_ZPchr0006g41889 [Zizania palustris]|uniref:Uncharacterized protein n=1 Tax=Zizania palustris TaxID=103762 RepID=A0A8J5S7G8_ZIZPA|nr:hypothetical protein GUJ93_ZPchr0006g41889 [Zizania palustris]